MGPPGRALTARNHTSGRPFEEPGASSSYFWDTTLGSRVCFGGSWQSPSGVDDQREEGRDQEEGEEGGNQEPSGDDTADTPV